MVHWFKKKKIKLEVFTNQQYAFDQFQPMLAKKFIPDWWKKLPASRTDAGLFTEGNNTIPVSSMKQCPAINEILKTGVIFPSWCELYFKVGEFGEIEQRVFPEHTALIPHDAQDWLFHKPEYSHVKVGSPWLIRETSGVDFMWIKPDWHTTDPLAYWGVPGIVEYKYQHAVLNNIMVKNGSEIKINAGDPWLQLIPLSDAEIEIDCQVVSSEEMSRLNTTNISAVGSYMKTIKNIKKQKERLDGKNN